MPLTDEVQDWTAKAKLLAEGLVNKRKSDEMSATLAQRVRDAKHNVNQKQMEEVMRALNSTEETEPNEELDTSLEDYSSNDEVKVSKVRLDEASVWLNRKHDTKKVIAETECCEANPTPCSATPHGGFHS